MENYIKTAPTVEVSDKLFNLFKSIPGNGSKDKNDFYKFLTTPGIDRELFLSNHCISTLDVVGNTIIHKLILQ